MIDYINGCRLFIGSLSLPLSIAHSLDVPRIAISRVEEHFMIDGMENVWKNFAWINDSKKSDNFYNILNTCNI